MKLIYYECNYLVIKKYTFQPLLCNDCTLFLTPKHATVSDTSVIVKDRNKCRIYFNFYDQS